MSNLEGSIIIFEGGIPAVISKVEFNGFEDNRWIFWITLANDDEFQISLDDENMTGEIYQTEINFQIL